MPKETPKERVPSRKWSCSEMVQGHASLIKTKKEKDSEEELQKKIQDWFCRVLLLGWSSANKNLVMNHHECRTRDSVQHMFFSMYL